MSKIFDTSFIQSFHQDRFISTKYTDKVFEEIDFIFQMAELKKQRPANLMLIGESGAGKTSLLNEYCRKRPFTKKRRKDGILKTKYVTIEMPVAATEKRLLEELLKAIGGSVRTSDPEKSFDAIVEKIGLKAIIIDEFHNLLGAQKNNLVNTLNQLKRITNIPRVSLIIAGTPAITRVLEFDEQFDTRFQRVVLPNWSETKDFKQFVVNYLNCLPLELPEKLPSAIFSELLSGPSTRTYDVVRVLCQSAMEACNKDDIANLDKYIRKCAVRTANLDL